MKRIAMFVLLILILLSVISDLRTNRPGPIEQTKNAEIIALQAYTIEAGDTVLSVLETLNNGQLPHDNIEKMLKDFSYYNSQSDPYELEQGVQYYFPVYKVELQTR